MLYDYPDRPLRVALYWHTAVSRPKFEYHWAHSLAHDASVGRTTIMLVDILLGW